MLFRALAEPNRLLILQHLLTGDHTVRELTQHLGMAQSTVSAHLACLLDCGLVSTRPSGRSTIWSMAAEAELIDVLTSAERLLKSTGYAAVLCPNCGAGANGSDLITQLAGHGAA